MKFSRSLPLLPNPRRLAISGSLILLLGVTLAWAASFKHVGSHVTSKKPDQVWRVMTAYDETCSRGCKYTRPNLVALRQLEYGRTENKWYTWTHIGNAIKDAKYFTEVKITRKPDGNFVAANRQLTKSDKALVAKLEKTSGLRHSPAFDGGGTTTSTTTQGGRTVVTQTMRVYTGALVGLWEGRILSEMKKNMAALFKNIGT